MAGHQHTLQAGLAASVVLVAACSFDTSVRFEGATDSGDNTGGFTPDAGVVADAGRQLVPDAADIPLPPDATPAVPDGTLQSFRRTQQLILDGELDAEWQALTFVEFALADAQLLETVPNYVADASLRMASLYDNDRVYFFVEVQDDIIIDDSADTYNDDSIELSIDGLNDRTGPLNDDDHWVVIGAEGVYASLGPDAIDLTGAILRTPTGYNIEVAFDREDLGAGMATTMGFNIALNDDDDLGGSGVDAYGLWHLPTSTECTDCCDGFAANYPWCDTTRVGQLELVP